MTNEVISYTNSAAESSDNHIPHKEEVLTHLTLDDLLGLSEEEYAVISQAALSYHWCPQEGPQSEAYFCPADIIYYGGQAGGGKTDLLIGLAINEHTSSLILRRYNKDARGLYKRTCEIIRAKEDDISGNKQTLELEFNNRDITFGGVQFEEDRERYKGVPHDLVGFDEISDFTRSQFEFIIGWNRSAKPNQRCRVVCTGNPPTTAEGRWVLDYFAAWLDPKYPNPAKSGEIRWFIKDERGRDVEVPAAGMYTPEGAKAPVKAVSRTFIRARLEDNKYLAATDYGARLDAMPVELRAAYRDGRFDLLMEDAERQIIPTNWVLAAVERWKKGKPEDMPMCAMGVDIAQGGQDNTTLAMRYDSYFEILTKAGKDTPTGREVAALILLNRRNNAPVTIDMGGGYGGSTMMLLEESSVPTHAFKGATSSTARTIDGSFGFYNKRSEALWRFREALDPENGSTIALPDDNGLIADLCAPTFTISNQGIKAETKDEIKKRLGRSPDKGDAIIMAWQNGMKMVNFRDGKIVAPKRYRPQVHLGHEEQRRKLR